MPETLVPIELPPGLFRNGTRLQAAGRWYDGHLVRFLTGTKQPVGGWQRMQAEGNVDLSALEGTPRAAISWSSDSGDAFLAVGTTTKLYVIAGATLYDITPVGFTAGREDTDILASAATTDGGSSFYDYGPYGIGAYGVGSSMAQASEADTWQLDVFGNYLVATWTGTGDLYVWEADPLSPAAIPAGAPASARGVVVTPERFLVALGAGGNVRAVQWPSQETTTTWTPAATNSAGDFELMTNGRLRAGRRTRRETLLWTDADLHTMQYIGGQLIYRFDVAGTGCGLAAPNAVAVFDTVAVWMGRDSFFTYDGFVRPLPCDVHDEVFGNMNKTQVVKAWAMTIAEFGEVWWFYPSATSLECDRYVVWNYRENHWSAGALARTAGVDAGAAPHPVMIAPTGEVYEHEIGQNRGDEVPFLESGPFQIGSGERVASVQSLIPDEKTRGDVSATLYTAMRPTDTETAHAITSLDAGRYDVRLMARHFRLRLEEARQTDWRVGTLSLGIRQAGRR